MRIEKIDILVYKFLRTTTFPLHSITLCGIATINIAYSVHDLCQSINNMVALIDF